MKTFSVGFIEDDQSELADARQVARAVGADHHELELSMSDTTTSLEDLVWALDEPWLTSPRSDSSCSASSPPSM